MGVYCANQIYAILVEVPNTKTIFFRKFTKTNKFYPICRNYSILSPNFFYELSQRKIYFGNKFTQLRKWIEAHWQLPNLERFCGHSFRGSSATRVEDAGGDITGWCMNSIAVAEGFLRTYKASMPSIFWTLAE